MYLLLSRSFPFSRLLLLSLFITSQTFGQIDGSPITATNVYGVTSTDQLVRFNSTSPQNMTVIGSITGLQGGDTILGIDFRPATGELFALGSGSRLYVINKTTAAATFVATLSTSLNGTSFGVDFNPTVDRIRIISNTGQNLRVNPANGVAIIDGAINGVTTSVDGAGYTNSYNGTTTTTLYDVSAMTDTLYIQNPPNNGTLVAVGPLGIDITAVNGFDISPIGNAAFGAFTVAGMTSLYTLNLTTGTASSAGMIGNGTVQLKGFATETAMVTSLNVYGLTTTNSLVQFNSTRPNTALSTVSITGLAVGEDLLGIDFRPATGQLFGLGSLSRIYRMNTVTGVATLVGTLTTPLSGSDFGFDFNPVPDRIRITSDAEQNLRANPNDGTNVVDGTLAYASGDANFGVNPNIVASGYTNSFGGTTTTTLYNIDSDLNILTNQNPPNNGTLNTIGSLGVDATGLSGFDINPGKNIALASLATQGGIGSSLYSIDLMTGAASVIGPIANGATIRDIAISRNNAAGSAAVHIDFDGDGRSDPSIFRPTENTWYINRSSDDSFFAVPFGLASIDELTPGDYDGDGKTDIAIWRTTDGVFYVLQSSDNVVKIFDWGIAGDTPVARDYDGDGKTDFAVTRNEGGLKVWYVNNSATGTNRYEQFGLSTDKVAPGDYDGDGRSDIAIHRGDQGQPATFYVNRSTLGIQIVRWGTGGDLVVTGDYDGDGVTDFAVARPGTELVWYILQSSNSQLAAYTFGNEIQLTAQGDYDGDGKTDLATYDPTMGRFYIKRSTTWGVTEKQFGIAGDYPVANFATH